MVAPQGCATGLSSFHARAVNRRWLFPTATHDIDAVLTLNGTGAVSLAVSSAAGKVNATYLQRCKVLTRDLIYMFSNVIVRFDASFFGISWLWAVFSCELFEVFL